MEALRNSDLLSRILSGEQVQCIRCKKGIYKPFNPKFDINHCYICDCCGDHYHYDPIVGIV